MIASGDWWTLDDDGTLSVFIVGDMPDYEDWNNTPPWYSYRDSITSLTISDSVTSIGEYAFDECENLVSATIGSGVTSIGEHAFSECASLESVVIPDNVVHLGDSVFSNCSALSSVTIGDGVTNIPYSAFEECDSLESIIIGSGVTHIGEYAFGSCDELTSVTIQDSLTTIGQYAFDGSYNLTDVYYTGTPAQWNAIDIDDWNGGLTSATIHYNYTPPLVLVSVAITAPPTKTTYTEGETFDPSGMVVTATYSDDSTAAATGYAVSPSTALTAFDSAVTVSYTEGGVTATANIAITVRRAPDLKLIFNGVDFSSRISTYNVSYETNYRKVVTALNGTEYFGNGTRRPIITFTLFPMTDAQAKAVYDALKVMVSSCTYTDKATNTDRTAKFRVTSNLEYVFGLRSVDGNRYYKGGEIVLRGVTCLA